MPVDPRSYELYQEAEARARRTGQALVEVLDAMGLLWTPAKEHLVAVGAVHDLALTFGGKSASELLNFFYPAAAPTADMMFRAIDDWLEIYHRHLSQGKLGQQEI